MVLRGEINFLYGKGGIMETRGRVISVREWIWTLLVLWIPLVNIGFLIYWTFSGKANYNKKNYAIANWVIIAVEILLGVLYLIIFGAMAYQNSL